MTNPLKIVFAGTPDFAAEHMKGLLDAGFNVVAAYTQPDRPAGRGKKLQPSAVKLLALEHDIPVLQPENFKQATDQQVLADLKPDLMVVVAYGLLLPKAVLDIPRLGCINVHGSLLPLWRGAAPIQRSIWAGDVETGVTIMQMDEGLDTGDMLVKRSIPITPEDTSASLYQKLAQLGPQALVDTLTQFSSLIPEKQDDSKATYAKKLNKEEALIDWHQSAEQLERNIRAFNPWPFAYFEVEGQRIKVWQANVTDKKATGQVGEILDANKTGIYVQTGQGVLVLTSLQTPGKKAMPVQAILNGKADWFKPGTCLS